MIFADKAAEKGLRAAGATEQTISGIRLAAVVVAFIILHRSNRLARSGSQSAGDQTAPQTGSSPNTLPISENEPFRPKFERLPQDIAVNPQPPKASAITRPIGLNEAQYVELQADNKTAQGMNARDILVNQQQVNASGTRVGVNRPDLQFTLETGERVYVEYDTPGSQRALGHLHRIQANDPLGKVILKTIPADQ